jgi:uncharacterized membrane protein YphA (DoxX/SURF4 family)
VNPLPSALSYARWLAVLRILTGGIWLVHAIPKFTDSDSFMPPNGAIVGFITKAIANPETNPAYHTFLANAVLPNIAIFAELVRLSELMVGVALVLGVLTRLGGFGSVFLTLNYMAASRGFSTFAAWGTLDATLLIMSLPNLVLPTGRVWGIDMFFGMKAEPKPETVRAEFVDEPPLGPTAERTDVPRDPSLGP